LAKNGDLEVGLAMSYSIMRSRSGAITIDPSMAIGTVLQVYLSTSEEGTVKENHEDDCSYFLRGKRILLVDDEEMIRDVTGRILKNMGASYILFAEEGQKALEIYREYLKKQEPIDAVIMDLTILGGMGGKEAIDELRKIDPEVKAVVSSGYAGDPILSNYRKFGFKGVLIKPYNIEELKNILKEVLSNSN
jgi:CheY-like chemotaxis protein